MNKKILILGGTQMIGRDFVEHYLDSNLSNSIVIANRGITNNNLFIDIEKITIDRSKEDGCRDINFRHFDTVIDFSCYSVSDLLSVLKYVKYNKYIILSSLCSNDTNILLDKKHWLNSYCLGKKETEQYITSNNIDNFTIVRPCVLYGKYDYTNRFYEKNNKIYWKNNNVEVVPDKYHIPVRQFSESLYKCLDINAKIINIDGEGINIMDKSNHVIHRYESSNIDVKKFTSPFKHIVIDNLFSDQIYQKLCDKFPVFISRTKPYKDQPGATSDYEGYISGLGPSDLTDGYDFFASIDLQSFIEKEFDIKTNKYISPSAHFHKAPSKNGFIHRDYNICSFMHNKNDVFTTTGGTSYTDDTKYNKNSVKVIRSVALLYYLNNKNDESSVGGGTGIYNGYQGELIKTIEPKNNRLFIFEMTYNSYHAFIGANFDRSAIVSWFHSSPAYMINRHWKFFRKYPNLIERWSRKNEDEYWSIENDPEYYKYFNKPLKDLI